METLYRKVQFEINCKDHDETWLIGKSANFIFNPNTRSGEELSDFLAGCEEVPDATVKLKADKAELLEALEKVKRLEPIICMGGAVAEQWQNEAQALNEMMAEIESLIQKHKQ